MLEGDAQPEMFLGQLHHRWDCHMATATCITSLSLLVSVITHSFDRTAHTYGTVMCRSTQGNQREPDVRDTESVAHWMATALVFQNNCMSATTTRAVSCSTCHYLPMLSGWQSQMLICCGKDFAENLIQPQPSVQEAPAGIEEAVLY